MCEGRGAGGTDEREIRASVERVEVVERADKYGDVAGGRDHKSHLQQLAVQFQF